MGYVAEEMKLSSLFLLYSPQQEPLKVETTTHAALIFTNSHLPQVSFVLIVCIYFFAGILPGRYIHKKSHAKYRGR